MWKIKFEVKLILTDTPRAKPHITGVKQLENISRPSTGRHSPPLGKMADSKQDDEQHTISGDNDFILFFQPADKSWRIFADFMPIFSRASSLAFTRLVTRFIGEGRTSPLFWRGEAAILNNGRTIMAGICTHTSKSHTNRGKRNSRNSRAEPKKFFFFFFFNSRRNYILNNIYF